MYSPNAEGPRRRRLRGSAFLFAITLLTCPRVRAQSANVVDARTNGPRKALTLGDALVRFRAHGFDLIIADATVANAAGDLAIAKSTANPTLSVSRGRSFHYDPSLCQGCSSTSISVSITDQAALSDRLSGKRRLRLAVARAALEATRSSRSDAERTLEFTVKQEVLLGELARQAREYARESQRLTSDTLKLVDTQYKAGAVSEADVARAEVQKLEADQAADLAEENYESAKAGVAFLLGYRETPPDFDLSDDLTHTAPADFVSLPRETLLEQARAHRPDFEAARYQVERARASLELAKRQRMPDVFPSLQYSREGNGQSAIQPPTLTFGVTASFPVFYRDQGEIAKSAADLETQEAILAKVDAQIGSDVGVAYAALTSARRRSARMETRLLGQAALARDLVRLQYQKGAASLFEFLDAQRTFLATQTEYLQTLDDYWTAVFQIEQATGMELDQ